MVGRRNGGVETSSRKGVKNKVHPRTSSADRNSNTVTLSTVGLKLERGSSSQSNGNSNTTTHHGTNGPSSKGSSSGGGGEGELPPSILRRRKPLDPSLLARGMTSRSLGSRITSQIKPLSSEQVERDIRHFEAYSSAYVSYAQQYFMYTNRDLVVRGVYGSVTPPPGISSSDAYIPTGATTGKTGANNGGTTNTGTGTGTGAIHPSAILHNPNANNPPPYTINTHGYAIIPETHAGIGGVTLPVKIDPEEEQRLTLLRKRVAVSEAKREVLETEYLSLRAHYVHESHRLRQTRSFVSGQLKLLEEIVRRRGKVLALRRVRCAVAREIQQGLQTRSLLLEQEESGDKDGTIEGVGGGSNSIMTEEHKDVELVHALMETANNANPNETPPSATTPNTTSNDTKIKDLMDQWIQIETQLAQAEQECTQIPTPPELLQTKNCLVTEAAAAAITEQQSNPPTTNASGGKSSRRIREREEEESSCASGASGGHKKKRKKSMNVETSEFMAMKKALMEESEDTIPWKCMSMPRTPFDVSLYISPLSKMPDGSAAFECGPTLGTSTSSLLWLDQTLPKQIQPEKEKETQQLYKLRKEVQILSSELETETKMNKDLQKKIVDGRKKSDELCSMIHILRAETDALLHRRN